MKRIIDTGRHRPKAKIWDLWELHGKRKQLVEKPILRQSKRDKTVLYGRFAVNQLLGKGYHRETYDFDIYSPRPLHHAIQIEQSIDRGTNSNLAFVEPSIHRKGLFRVKTRPHGNVEADFNPMPSNIRFKQVRGVRYETIGRAEQKYQGMIKKGEIRRFPRAFYDKYDIDMYKIIKKNKNWR